LAFISGVVVSEYAETASMLMTTTKSQIHRLLFLEYISFNSLVLTIFVGLKLTI